MHSSSSLSWLCPEPRRPPITSFFLHPYLPASAWTSNSTQPDYANPSPILWDLPFLWPILAPIKLFCRMFSYVRRWPTCRRYGVFIDPWGCFHGWLAAWFHSGHFVTAWLQWGKFMNLLDDDNSIWTIIALYLKRLRNIECVINSDVKADSLLLEHFYANCLMGQIHSRNSDSSSVGVQFRFLSWGPKFLSAPPCVHKQ